MGWSEAARKTVWKVYNGRGSLMIKVNAWSPLGRWRVTLGDADFRKSLTKMIYRNLSKTASSSVTCHARLLGQWLSRPMGDREQQARKPSADVLGKELGFYLIILSARYSTDCGIVRLSALAVLRLMMNSKFVGCSTGNSAALAPFKILST